MGQPIMTDFFRSAAFVCVAIFFASAPALSEDTLMHRSCGQTEHSFVAVDGTRLHYAIMGSGDTNVVMIHGASGNLCDLKIALGSQAAEKFRVLLVDRPGLGRSDRPANGHDPHVQAGLIKAAGHALGFEGAIVLGHSLGGLIALTMALDHADYVKALVLLAPVSHPWPGGVDWFHHAATTPVIGPLFRRTFVPTVGRMIGKSSTGAPFPEGYYEQAGVDLLFRAKTFKANSQDLIHVKRFTEELSPRYGELQMPIEIISGGRDRSVSTTIHSRALVEQAPHAKLVVIDGAGHQIQHERADDALEALNRAAQRAHAS